MIATRIQFAIRLGLAMIFLYAAATKTLQQGNGNAPTLFAEWSRFPPTRYAVICSETMLALWLLSGIKLSLSGVVALAVLSAFCGLLVLELGREYPKACGCMGAAVAAANPQAIRSSLRFDLARNAFMMAGAVWLYLSAQPCKYSA